MNLIKDKRSMKLKGRTCVDGKPRWALYTREEKTLPTESIDALMINITISAFD